MVGKIKHVRQKLHQAAATLVKPSSLTLPGFTASTGSLLLPTADKRHFELPLLDTSDKQGPAKSSFTTGIFSGIKINPEVLVQDLKFEANPDTPTSLSKGSEEKTCKSKKEKMKERRERWLNKICSIKQAKEQQVAQARRQATPVVGDLRPLADALPELSQLIADPAVHRKSRKMPMKKSEPGNLRQTKESQKRKLLEEECSWFSDTVKTLSSKKYPLAEIGEQLRKRMKQEEEDPS